MVAIKKQHLKAYILLESLLTLSVFVFITSLLLTAVQQGRLHQDQDYQQEEALNLAKMALQTGRSRLSLNGVEVDVVRDDQQISVYQDGRLLLHVEKE